MSDVEELFDEQADEQRKLIDRLQRKIAKEQTRTDQLMAAVYQAVEDSIAALTIPKVTAPKKDRRTKDEETAVLLLSDWQLGKKTPTYSSDVTEERIHLLTEKVSRLVEIQRGDHPVKKVALFLLGDMIEGELIFPGQSWQIDASLFRQVTVDGPRILSHVVRWAQSEFEEVVVHAVPGNHGHIGGRARKDMHPESNGDRMLYQITSQLVPEVDWRIAEDWWAVADLGEKCRFLLLHGDNVRGYNGIPWYGWTRKVLAWSSLSSIWPDMAFDHVTAGHFHTPVSIYVNGRRLWINASTESHNPYALEQLAAAGEPAQWLLFAKPERGVTAEYLVNLG
jgi:hypothetical protein